MIAADPVPQQLGRQSRPPAHAFGCFELRPLERQLLHQGVGATLSARAFDLLVSLVEHAGRLVSKEELLEAVWPDVIVEENNLQKQISAVRKAIGRHAIATISGRGYRFVATVQPAVAEPGPPPAAPSPPGLPTTRRSEAADPGSLCEYILMTLELASRWHHTATLMGAGSLPLPAHAEECLRIFVTANSAPQ